MLSQLMQSLGTSSFGKQCKHVQEANELKGSELEELKTLLASIGAGCDDPSGERELSDAQTRCKHTLAKFVLDRGDSDMDRMMVAIEELVGFQLDWAARAVVTKTVEAWFVFVDYFSGCDGSKAPRSVSRSGYWEPISKNLFPEHIRALVKVRQEQRQCLRDRVHKLSEIVIAGSSPTIAACFSCCRVSGPAA